jgi:CBS domain-containing protein
MNVEQLLRTKGAEATIIGPETTIRAAARLLAERNKGLALVCDAAVGEFAERAPAMAVEIIMTTDFAFCRLEDSGEDVLQNMTERRVRHLPVVEDGVLKGFLNMRGVLESRFEEAEIRTDEMRRYVFGVGYH